MRISFAEDNLSLIVEKIKSTLGTRELSKMVNFEIKGQEMVVTISKLGTSSLHFTFEKKTAGCVLTLTKEKIALTHKPLKGEVTGKIVKVIEKAGGQVLVA